MAQKDQIIFMTMKTIQEGAGLVPLNPPCQHEDSKWRHNMANGVPHGGDTTDQENCHYLCNLCPLYVCLGVIPSSLDLVIVKEPCALLCSRGVCVIIDRGGPLTVTCHEMRTYFK